jgi:GxxExxY protein
MTLTRVLSSLSPELENLVEAAIGCCLSVHRELGPGLNERVYSRACRIELETRGLSYDAERPVPIRYRGNLICTQRIDLLIEGQVIVEVKSVESIRPVHVAQAVSYLRATGLRVALVINFNVAVLKQGIRRVVL